MPHHALQITTSCASSRDAVQTYVHAGAAYRVQCFYRHYHSFSGSGYVGGVSSAFIRVQTAVDNNLGLAPPATNVFITAPGSETDPQILTAQVSGSRYEVIPVANRRTPYGLRPVNELSTYLLFVRRSHIWQDAQTILTNKGLTQSDRQLLAGLSLLCPVEQVV